MWSWIVDVGWGCLSKVHSPWLLGKGKQNKTNEGCGVWGVCVCGGGYDGCGWLAAVSRVRM